MDKIYPRGSEWRKWDLHIHTPKSINQQYGGDTREAWDKFILTLSELPDEVKVIAINDYLFIDGYEEVLKRRTEIPKIELIIPNIEFRLDTFSGTEGNNKRHNFHVLFDPSIPISTIREQFLNCLSKGYLLEDGVEWNQTASLTSLAELGKKIKNAAPAGNSIHNKTDLDVGFDNITYNREEIFDLLAKDPFRGKYLTAMGYSEWDQGRWDQSAATKRDLVNKSGFCITCVDDLEKIAEHVSDLRRNKIGASILHSSDAHKFERVGQTKLWIKADPTFAGLKQIVNEPGRIFIGDFPPNLKPDHKVISKVTITNSSGWFKESLEIDLNKDLVSIIGGRGSGKSALAEMIAYGGLSPDVHDESFIKKATGHQSSILETRIELTWLDGSPSGATVGDFEEKEGNGLVRFLSQRSIERLCSPDKSDELLKQIENVIFQSLDDTEKMGTSNFEELQNQTFERFNDEKTTINTSIKNINKKINSLVDFVGSIREKNIKRDTSNKDLEKLRSSLPKLPPADIKGQDELAKLLDLKGLFEQKLVGFQKNLARIREAETKLKILQNKIKESENEIFELLNVLGLKKENGIGVKVDATSITTFIEDQKQKITDSIETLKSGNKVAVSEILGIEMEKLLFNNFNELVQGIQLKENDTKAFESIKTKYQEQRKLILNLENNIKALDEEIKKINEEYKPQIESLKDERMVAYISYFGILKNEMIEIEKLYKPLQDTLASGSETDRRLKFEAKLSYRLNEHQEHCLNVIDRTKKGNFRDVNNLNKALHELWDGYSRGEFNPDKIKEEMEKLFKQFTNYEGGKSSGLENVKDQLKDKLNLEHFLNWLFETKYFEVVTSLKFEGTDLYLLSPGQKGMVLMILFLKIDKADQRPLIVDQPEENLDNLSVYKDLIDCFRERKKTRQIIIITHNPNLVVNTDSEQVIVANYDGTRNPRLEYVSGSLEDQAKGSPDLTPEQFQDGIIERVCNILEGGENAFENRNKKYKISLRSRFH